MATQHRLLVNHTFQGKRFEDHGIDFDVLPDLLRYKQILVDVAKSLWREHHPDRERLPRHFEEQFAIKFFQVVPNCATIPLERSIDPQHEFWGDELEEAAELVCDAIDAARDDRALPDNFPRDVLKQFDEYGKTLRDDEWIELHGTRRQRKCRYERNIGARLAGYAENVFEGPVDVVGTVTMARVTRPRMAIELEGGREVEAAFQPDDEAIIVTALRDHSTAKVRVTGKGEYSPTGVLLKLTEVGPVQLLPQGEAAYDPDASAIWDEFETIIVGIPPSELAKLPTDGAMRHDHYIYGTPAHRQ